jgi:hypothetical protein
LSQSAGKEVFGLFGFQKDNLTTTLCLPAHSEVSAQKLNFSRGQDVFIFFKALWLVLWFPAQPQPIVLLQFAFSRRLSRAREWLPCPLKDLLGQLKMVTQLLTF